MPADILRCIDRFADFMILRSGGGAADNGSQFWGYPFTALEGHLQGDEKESIKQILKILWSMQRENRGQSFSLPRQSEGTHRELFFLLTLYQLKYSENIASDPVTTQIFIQNTIGPLPEGVTSRSAYDARRAVVSRLLPILKNHADSGVVAADGLQFWDYPFDALEAERVSYLEPRIYMTLVEVDAVLSAGHNLEQAWPSCQRNVEFDRKIRVIYESKLVESETKMENIRKRKMDDDYDEMQHGVSQEHTALLAEYENYQKFDTFVTLPEKDKESIKQILKILWGMQRANLGQSFSLPRHSKGTHIELFFLLTLYQLKYSENIESAPVTTQILIENTIGPLPEGVTSRSASDARRAVVLRLLPILKNSVDTIAEIKYVKALDMNSDRP